MSYPQKGEKEVVEAAGIAGQPSWPCASRAKLAREPVTTLP